MSDSAPRLCINCDQPTITQHDVWCHDCGRNIWYGEDAGDE